MRACCLKGQVFLVMQEMDKAEVLNILFTSAFARKTQFRNPQRPAWKIVARNLYLGGRESGERTCKQTGHTKTSKPQDDVPLNAEEVGWCCCNATFNFSFPYFWWFSYFHAKQQSSQASHNRSVSLIFHISLQLESCTLLLQRYVDI